jgi:hypothetical protein
MRLFRDRTALRARPIAIGLVLAGVTLAFAGNALATNPPTVLLQTADSFALIGGAAITDVPTSTIRGDVGLSPAAGSFITGLTCAEVTGTIYSVDATGPLPCRVTNPGLLTTATAAVTAAYVNAAGRTPDTTFATLDNQLGGQSLVPGVYAFGHATTANLIGNLTLAGNADSVWIFQASSDLVTAASSTVTLTGGAQACNVFWKVGSAATLGTSSTLVGTVLAHDDISVTNAVTVQGRLLAGAQASGAITLISDTITRPSTCVTQASIDQAAAAAEQATNAANVARTAAENAIKDAAAAQAAAVAKGLADAKAAAVVAAKAAADAKAAAVVAAKAAAAKDAKAAKAAAAKAVALAKVAAKAKAKALSTSRNLARPARRHVGLTG